MHPFTKWRYSTFSYKYTNPHSKGIFHVTEKKLKSVCYFQDMYVSKPCPSAFIYNFKPSLTGRRFNKEGIKSSMWLSSILTQQYLNMLTLNLQRASVLVDKRSIQLLGHRSLCLNVSLCCSKPWQLQQSQMLSCSYNKRFNIAKQIYSLWSSLLPITEHQNQQILQYAWNQMSIWASI